MKAFFEFPWTKRQRLAVEAMASQLLLAQQHVTEIQLRVADLTQENEILRYRVNAQALAAKRYLAIRQGHAEHQGDVFAVVNIARGDSAVRGDDLDNVVDHMIHNYNL